MTTAILTIVDGVRVIVPDSLNLITPYVLLEQQDWFEDEIKFLRRLLQPGQKVIDIGANYGVYTLSMARTLGPTGRVWAFEPASGTARLLAEAIADNGFTQVVLERSALSSCQGAAQLSLNENSELNALVHDKPSAGASETVPLVTLDACMERYNWRDIEFMKIDAEGEEANILKGGRRFFAELSPLVQYEIRAGEELHTELVQDFAALGYESYRLVPGLDLLVPFDAESPPDGYLLNLFCCKKDRARQLAAQGHLLDPAGSRPDTATGLFMKTDGHDAYCWRDAIATLPYGVQLAELWEQTMAAGNSAEVDEALSLYALCRDLSRSPYERYHALESSLGIFNVLCACRPTHLRLASLSRIARDYGARLLAVNALHQLSDTILNNNTVDASEPFLAPGALFDAISPGQSIGNWVLAAVLEEFERLAAYSSFYTGVSAKHRLEAIRTLGYGSAEMSRRLSLVQKRFGLPS